MDLRPSRPLNRFVDRTHRGLLTLLIRSKYGTIASIKQHLRTTWRSLPNGIRSRLSHIIRVARNAIRQIYQPRLISKFNDLLHQQWQQRRLPHNQQRTSTSPTSSPGPGHRIITASTNATQPASIRGHCDCDQSEKITVLDNVQVPASARLALSKGPKFALTPHWTQQQLQHKIQVELAALAYTLRWHSAMSNEHSSKTPVSGVNSSTTTTSSNNDNNDNQDRNPLATLQRICPFHNSRKEPPRSNPGLEKSIKDLQVDLERLVQKHNPSGTKRNISSASLQAVAELRNQEDTIITRSDKGGELVVMKKSHLRQLCIEHLFDSSTYTKLDRNPTDSLRLQVNRTFKSILTRRGFPDYLIRHLQTPSTVKTQRFYALPKTHKKLLAIRPIVSACGGTFDRLGWFLQHLLKPLLRHVSAHIDCTSGLLRHFNSMKPEHRAGLIPVSFDVVALYTNINTEEAITATLEYCIKHDLYLFGLTTTDVRQLLHLLLDNNVFAYEDVGFFRQIRGLAMGNSLSGTLAILCMDRLEQRVIYKELKPPMYARYIDDIGTVVPSVSAAENILQVLNNSHPTIKFELELPDNEQYLPILDVKIRITDDGSISHKLYVKSANKGITLHYDSHHPSSVKRAMVKNELQRAIACSTPEHRSDSLARTINKLQLNGYPNSWLRPTPLKTSTRSTPYNHHNRYKPRPRPRFGPRKQVDDHFPFTIPFISDEFNGRVKKLLLKNHIPAHVVNAPQRTLQQFSAAPAHTACRPCTSKDCPAKDICRRSNVVYLATCQLCDEQYIGQTSRQLHVRAREHLRSAKQRSTTTALGDHYRQRHPNNTPSIGFKILRSSPDCLRLRILEAFEIKSRQPELNRKREDLGTGFLP